MLYDQPEYYLMGTSSSNLNKAYKAVMRNKGCGGIDRMSNPLYAGIIQHDASQGGYLTLTGEYVK